MKPGYIIVSRTGFCDYYVQYTATHAQHVRMTTHIADAIRFPSVDAANKHQRAGEELVWCNG